MSNWRRIIWTVFSFGTAIPLALGAEAGTMWNAPERMGRVAAIAPGAPQPVPNQIFTPEYLNKIRSGTNETEKAEARRVADPLLTISDEAWREMIPDYSPYPSFGLLFVCPFCGRKLGQQDPHNRNRFDIAQPHEAARPCCDTVMYEDTGDAPADYPYKADRVLKVAHMDGTVHDYPYWEGKNRLGDPSVLFARSAVWKTRLDYIHFTALPALANAWLKTGDERYARKALAIFHRLAEVYPAWPLWEYPKTNETYSWYRDQIDGRYDTPKKGGLAMGTDGKPLTREAFDALPRPNRFSEPSWGDANRFGTHGMGFFLGKLGWYYLAVKASPAAKTYSKEAFGDPDRLEAFIESRLFNELAKEFSSGRPMLGNYAQATMGEAVYIGVAANDPYLYNLGLEIADSLTLNHEYPDVSFQEGSILYNGQMSGTHNIVRDMLGGASDERERVFPFTKFARENMYRVFEGMSTWRGVQSGHGDGNDGEWVVGRVYGTRYGNPKADWAQWKEQPYDPSDPTRPISRFLPNYGFAVLASGAPGHRLESLFLFDKNVGHTHQGNLNLQLAWEGSLIAPELGYCAFWRTLDVSERNPMHDAIYAVPWRYRLLDNAEPKDGFNGVLEHENVWSLSHCGVFQNTVLVNERAGRHRGHTKTGYSQPVTLSAPPGSGGVGSILQVAEAEDATSWPTAGVDVTLYRRAVVNVERPDGRAYVADLFRVRGGERQCYEFKMPRAEIVRTDLSAGKEVGNGEAYLESIPGVKEWQTDAPEWSGNHADLGFRYLNDMTVYPAPESWWVRWLWDPRIRLDEAAGFPNVVVDMRGVEIPGPQQETRDEVWLSRSDYPLRLNEMIGEKRFQSAVVFEKGVSVYSRFRQGQPGLMTRFAHLFEMHEEGTSSTVMQAKYWPLAPSSVLDPSDRDDYGLALEVGFDDGGRDWLVSAPDAEGRHVEGAPEDLETAARFALVRTDRDGSFLEGALVDGRGFALGDVAVESAGSLTGTIADIRGDITGTRTESALLIQPVVPWPVGDCLRGERIFIEVLPDRYDAYTVGGVSREGGLVRVDLEGTPSLAYQWDRVKEIQADLPNVVEVVSQALHKSAGNDYFRGKRILFPPRGLDLRIEAIPRGAVLHMTRLVAVGSGTDLRAAGVKTGDPLVIYGMAVGQSVRIPSRIAVRRLEKRRYAVQANVNFTLRDGQQRVEIRPEEIGPGEMTIALSAGVPTKNSIAAKNERSGLEDKRETWP